MRQYYAMSRMCDRVFFNSDKNRYYFAALGLLPEAVTYKVIPNWYEFPAGYTANIGRRNAGPQVNVVYSGNMNTRIDWSLIAQVAGLSETTRMHLIGTVDASDRDFVAALDRPNIIYHGPRNERDTLHLLETMDLAIMPHKTDAVSTYMNPLKLQMYAAAGLPVISTDVPGIEPHKLLTIAGSSEAFVEAVRRLATTRQRRPPRSIKSRRAAEYIAEINALRAAR
jgi:glycosyltransferase involved in cell wall biosynthesis